MAKFKNGNLVLQSSQTIIQGTDERLDANGAAVFASLTLDSSLTTITSITTDGTLIANLDSNLPTEKAIKTYVDNKISGSIGPGDVNEIAVYDVSNGIKTSDVLISTDGTFADNSDTKLPTEKATKTYVDTKVAGTIATGTDRAVAVYDGTSNIVASGVYVDASGNTTVGGNLKVSGTTKAAGSFYAGTTTPDSTARLNFDGEMYASKFWNSVWNDIVDYQDLKDEFVPGKCYYDTLEGAKICRERCQKSVIGILSDTYGMALGVDSSKRKAPFAVAGWVLAYVEDECEPGDVLTNDEYGNLVRMREAEKAIWPERIVAIYKRPEPSDYWGTNQNKVHVNGRHWVKVK